MTDLSEVFKTAMQFEREGRRVYLETRQRVRDVVLRAVLESLAQDEEDHETMIRRYYEAVQKGEGWPAPETDSNSTLPARQRLEAIVAETAGKIGPEPTFLAIYEKARELELQSRDFYRAQADEAEDRQLVRFFRFLAGMEQTHLEMLGLLLQATQEAVESESERGRADE